MTLLAVAADWLSADRVFDDGSVLEAFAYRALRDALERRGDRFHTLDVYEREGESPDVILMLEVPTRPVPEVLAAHPGAEPWVLLWENAAVHAPNWDPARHQEFTQLFTWDDTLVDGRRYHKLNYPQRLEARPGAPQAERRGFLTLIAANKRSRHQDELYSDRVRAIRWYQRHHPGLLDLYGHGWDRPAQYVGAPAGRLRQLADRVVPARAEHYPAWRGVVHDKLATLGDYRFAICYENGVFPGYITEKPFDCFLTGTIAVYHGPENAADHLPPECFVDHRAFGGSEAAMHEYLFALPDDDVASMARAALDFATGPRAHPFSAAFFVDTLLARLDARAS